MMTAVIPRPTVLVADDDAATRLLLKATLEAVGFSVVQACDGRGAVDEFINNRIDLVLLDVEMPGLNGFQVCEEIRAQSAGRDLPIVMITGREDTASVNHAYEMGATDFICKPINWPLIGHRIRYIFRGAQTLQALAESESGKAALLETIPDTIFIVDRDGIVESCLNGTCSLGGRCIDALIGKSLSGILSRESAATVRSIVDEVLKTANQHSFDFELPKDAESAYHYEGRLIRHDEDRVLAILRDISGRKAAEAKIHHLAYYDALTGLPNRQFFMGKLHSAIQVAEHNQDMLATLYIGLDRFKRINDTLGHTVGDALLDSVADRLSGCIELPGGDKTANRPVLARVGGDEFAVLLPGMKSTAEAGAFAAKLRQGFAAPFKHGNHEFVVTPSIGISVYPRHGEDADSLLKNAVAAMSGAKSSGRNMHKVYSASMNARSMERLALENDLRRALEDNELNIHYQPKFYLQDSGIAGVEALLRWVHPDLGAVSPANFISVAEESGLIVDLGRWLVASVCRQLRDWQDAGIHTVPIAINLSGREFQHGDPVRTIGDAVRAARIDPALLELEITETVLMQDVESVQKSLGALKALGFRLTVDDFGTGYSSLGYLKGFPLDTVKIDRSFVMDISRDPDDAAICKAIVALGHSLGLTVIAEGVECESQLEFLRNLGCDQVQGFLLGRPMPADDIAALLKHEQSIQECDRTGADIVRLRR